MRDFVEQLKSRLVLSSVIGEYVRLTRKGKDLWGVCPFHKERTPSFVVHDDTGRYHCFGCGAGGDAISFLEKLRHFSFREAVEELAAKIGLSLPQKNSVDEKSSTRPLFQTLATASCWFQEQLTYTTGASARDYLESRGVSSEALKAFQLGWAPGSSYNSSLLSRSLQAQDIPLTVLETAGLVFEPQNGKPGRDRFRDRIMFPIHDTQGRVIGFGGRVLGQGEPKYLNSPETPVFLKNQHLYGLWQATQNASLRQQPVVVVEGYLDVIALQMAGLARAVAPLGTAMGEAQLLKAWRLSAELLICFDGDAAGHTAAWRTATKALSLLKPGFSLAFCSLPAREDPQSLLLKGEQATLQSLFSAPTPLVDYLWDALHQMIPLNTPESQASFRKQYKEWCALIPHTDVRTLYERTFDGRFYEVTRGKARNPLRSKPTQVLSLGLRENSKKELQIQILLLTLIHHPELIVEFASSLASLVMPTSSLKALQEALLEWADQTTLDLCEEKGTLEEYLKQRGLTEAVASWLDMPKILTHAAFAQRTADLQTARLGFQDVFDHYQREVTLKLELEEAHTTFARHMHAKTWRRFQKLKEIYVQLR